MQNNKPKINMIDLFLKYDAVMLVFVTFLGFLGATILLLLTNKNPIDMFDSFLQTISGYNSDRGTINPRYIGEWLNVCVPIILCGLSVGFALKSGIFNIGAEGQYMIGLTFAQIVANNFPPIDGLHVIVAILVAVVASALWGGLAGYLKGKYNVSEIVSTIMLNYIAFYFSRWITAITVKDTNSFRTPDFADSALLFSDSFKEITNNSMLNNSIYLMLLSVLIYYIIMQKTTLGLALKASGFNPTASHFSGVSNPVKTAFVAMAIAGAFAGLAGASVALGSFNYGRVLSTQDGYGFTGIAVALVGNTNAIGIFFSGLLFGVLQSSQSIMQTKDIPKETIGIISGLVVIFISLIPSLKIFLQIKNKKAEIKENKK